MFESGMQDTKKETSAFFSWRIGLIGPILIIHMFTYMGSYLILQQYAYHAVHQAKFPNVNDTQFTCESNTSTDAYKIQVQIQQETSNWILYVSLATGIPSIIANFIFGSYSDRYGRKIFLVLSFLGLLLKTIFCAVAIYLEWDLLLFVIFFLAEGIVGAQMVPVCMAFSMVADTTKAGKTRSFAIALIDMSIGVGMILGFLLSGYLIKALGYGLPIAIYSGLQFISLIVILFGVPETLKNKGEINTDALSQNVKDALSFYFDRKIAKEGKRTAYILCMFIFLLVLLSTLGKTHIDTLYELNIPFCWDAVRIGIFSMARNAAQFLIGIPAIKLLQRCMSDEYITLVGLLSNALSLVQEGLAPNSLTLYFVALVGFGAMIPVPLIKGMMSRITPATKQGALFAGLGAVSALCNVLGAAFANGIYSGTVGVYRGLVYLLMAGCCCIGIVLLLYLKLGIPQKALQTEMTNDTTDKCETSQSSKL